MIQVDPGAAATGALPLDGVTRDQREALGLIGQRIIGLTQDLERLTDQAHIQVVQELIDDLTVISRGVLPGYEVGFSEQPAEPEPEPAAGKAKRVLRNLAGKPIGGCLQITLGSGHWFSDNTVPDGVTLAQWKTVAIAANLIEQLYVKAQTGARVSVTRNWLKSIAADIRDIAELSDVRLTGRMVPGRYRARALKEPSVWDA